MSDVFVWKGSVSMGEQNINQDNNQSTNDEVAEFTLGENEIPGTAKIRKLGVLLSSMELLKLSARLAVAGEEKKLWSVLSRVFADKKSFNGNYEDGMDAYVSDIMSSDMPAELKLQAFTSFGLPKQFCPSLEECEQLINACDEKRENIIAYFVIDYELEKSLYESIKSRQGIMEVLVKSLPEKRLLDLYSYIFDNETKEFITGAIRLVTNSKRRFRHTDTEAIKVLTDKVFDAKQVFFTSKLLFCQAFDVPQDVVRSEKGLDKILKISINYEERITKEFIAKYGLNFEHSDLAMCKYYLGNKKTTNQKGLVGKFAAHLVRIQDPRDKSYLLRGAFKRGGYFRMYAGCMQDGYVDMNKMQRFHYSDEDVAWCSNLPGLRK